MSSTPDKAPPVTTRSKAHFRLPKGPLAAFAIALAIIIIVFITHGTQTTPPPYHRGSTVDQQYENKNAPCLESKSTGWAYEESYYVTVPVRHLPVDYQTNFNRESELFIGTFQGNSPDPSSNLLVKINGTTRQPPYVILFGDYSIVSGDDRTAKIDVEYQLNGQAVAPTDLSLVFYVKQHTDGRHYGKPPLTGRDSAGSKGGCGNAAPQGSLSYYLCLENSGSHAAEHVVISRMEVCGTQPG